MPEWLTVDCARRLHALDDRHPGMVEVHQHGFAHHNYGRSRSLKLEFGAIRSDGVQLAELRAGRERLTVAFPQLFAPVLSPPFGYVDETVRKLTRRAGFLGLSGAGDESGEPGLPAFSPQIDLLSWSPTRDVPWPRIVQSWRALASQPLGGFVVHPEAMSRAAADRVAAGLAQLVGDITTVRFGDLLGP